ncbi:unnamed protein product, partial [Ectocarpus sp. 13 AM-2016]
PLPRTVGKFPVSRSAAVVVAAVALALVVATGKGAGNRNADGEVVHLEPLVLSMALILMLRAGRSGVVAPSPVVPAPIELADVVVGGCGGGGVAVVVAAAAAASTPA